MGKKSKFHSGPLSRIELGNNQVQGIDYAYTLQGWIKGVNSNVLIPKNDIGHDSWNSLNNPTYANRNFAKDAFSYTLGYYQGDYSPINDTMTAPNLFEAQLGLSNLKNNRNNLYNGNISHMITTICNTVNFNNVTPSTAYPQGMAYKYDQLNRLRNAIAFQNLDLEANTWNTDAPGLISYQNNFTYDANGNILTQNRRNSSGIIFDSLIYHYQYDAQNRLLRNRLYHLNDLNPDSSIAGELIDQGLFVSDSSFINSNNNYSYDEIGNLIKDTKEDIHEIQWTVSGKVKKIIRNTGSDKVNLSFEYDPMGNRIAKHILNNSGQIDSSTYYTRDAQGNIMAIYQFKTIGESSSSFRLIERPIYGSSRVGINTAGVELISYVPNNTSVHKHNLRFKQYELSNHLGNILSSISDSKIPIYFDSTFSFFMPEVISATDYYAFGMPMPGRNFDNSNYRFHFNGQENDNEVAGLGNITTAQFWEYDTRSGRRWNLDPLVAKYPHQSPYAAFNNNSIY